MRKTIGHTLRYRFDVGRPRQDDFGYVKNWSSYHNYGQVKQDGEGWMLTGNHMSLTNNAHTMHCLPVRRNVELSDEILDHPNCLTTTQAANRVWAAQAVLGELLRKDL